MALCALRNFNINVDYIIDEDPGKKNLDFYNCKIISPEDLAAVNKNCVIFISHNSFEKAIDKLTNLKLNNFYSCVDLWQLTNFNSFSNQQFLSNINPTDIKISGLIDYHYYSVLKFLSLKNSKLIMTNVDFCITERCSMKCKDCGNLMQYYEKPQNTDEEIMMKSIDRIMQCIDELLEARVFGGDPFMNKEMYKYVNKLSEFKNIKHIVLYTNAVIFPKNENLECLKKDKVRVHITDYGDKLSKEKNNVINFCKKNNIKYECDITKKWDPIGKIEYTNETPEILKKKFEKCCVNNLFQVLHGKVYKCPFSAHGSNMKIFAENEKYDFLDLLDEKVPINDLKKKLYNFYHAKDYLSACEYCLGRGVLIHGEPKIQAAIQTKKYLSINKLNL